jgi:indolepyruvate ferredoxin oxidoreductase beta subunit
VKFDATALAEEAGDAIATNMVMLGAIVESGTLPFSEKVVTAALRSSVRATYLEINLKAFKMGRNAYEDSSK